MSARLDFSRASRRDERGPSDRGFSLIELMLVVAVVAIVGVIGIPAINNMLPSLRVSSSARAVERQLQTARLKSVSSNRPIRVRFNCPAADQYRMVELIGTTDVPADDDTADAATRCSQETYPYPDVATGVFDLPNNDGPVQTLERDVVFVDIQTIEFWPDGTAHVDAGTGNPWPAIPSDDPVEITVRLTIGTSTQQAESVKTIEVNGLGRIRIQ
jgi:prepilin-type N-terminal cleavage/methylation domain-containing protein